MSGKDPELLATQILASLSTRARTLCTASLETLSPLKTHRLRSVLRSIVSSKAMNLTTRTRTAVRDVNRTDFQSLQPQIVNADFMRSAQLPPPIVKSRQNACRCACSVDFEDPCATCPKKRWGPQLCETPFEDLLEEQALQTEYELPFPAARALASNFLSSVGSELKARIQGQNELPLETIKRRYSICEGCEFFHAPSKRCKKCGCFLRWKTAWRSQSCPIGKW